MGKSTGFPKFDDLIDGMKGDSRTSEWDVLVSYKLNKLNNYLLEVWKGSEDVKKPFKFQTPVYISVDIASSSSEASSSEASSSEASSSEASSSESSPSESSPSESSSSESSGSGSDDKRSSGSDSTTSRSSGSDDKRSSGSDNTTSSSSGNDSTNTGKGSSSENSTDDDEGGPIRAKEDPKVGSIKQLRKGKRRTPGKKSTKPKAASNQKRAGPKNFKKSKKHHSHDTDSSQSDTDSTASETNTGTSGESSNSGDSTNTDSDDEVLFATNDWTIHWLDPELQFDAKGNAVLTLPIAGSVTETFLDDSPPLTYQLPSGWVATATTPISAVTATEGSIDKGHSPKGRGEITHLSGNKKQKGHLVLSFALEGTPGCTFNISWKPPKIPGFPTPLPPDNTPSQADFDNVSAWFVENVPALDFSVMTVTKEESKQDTTYLTPKALTFDIIGGDEKHKKKKKKHKKQTQKISARKKQKKNVQTTTRELKFRKKDRSENSTPINTQIAKSKAEKPISADESEGSSEDENMGCLCVYIQTKESGREAGDPSPTFKTTNNSRYPIPDGYSASIIISNDMFWENYFKPHFGKLVDQWNNKAFTSITDGAVQKAGAQSPATKADVDAPVLQLDLILGTEYYWKTATQKMGSGFVDVKPPIPDEGYLFWVHADPNALNFFAAAPSTSITINDRGQLSWKFPSWGEKGTTIPYDFYEQATDRWGNPFERDIYGEYHYEVSMDVGNRPLFSVDNEEISIKFKIDASDWNAKYYPQKGGDVSEMSDWFDKWSWPTFDSSMRLDYFATTNIFAPGQSFINIDQDVGVRLPRDLVLVGKICKPKTK